MGGGRDQHLLEVIVRGRETATAPHPIVFVHGTGHAAWCWDNFAGYFAAAGFATFAVSLRGHGASGGASRLRGATIADYVEDVRRVAESLPALPVLFGHSLGGLVVQRYLQQHPAAAAVLVAPAPTAGMLLAKWTIGLQHPLALLHCLLKRDFAAFYSTTKLTHQLLYLPDTPREYVEQLAKRIGPESFAAAAAMLWPLTGRRTFECPLLVIGGAQDKVLPVRYLRSTAKALGADLVVLENAAHSCISDIGWERAAAACFEWLASRGLARAALDASAIATPAANVVQTCAQSGRAVSASAS